MHPIVINEVSFFGAWNQPGVLRIGRRHGDCAVRLGPAQDGTHKVAVFAVERGKSMVALTMPCVVEVDGIRATVKPDGHHGMRVAISGSEVADSIEAIALALKAHRNTRERVRYDPLASTASEVETDRDHAVNTAIQVLAPLVARVMEG